MKSRTVDFIEAIDVDEKRSGNALITLAMLTDGLAEIASFIKTRETQWAERIGPNAKFSCMGLDVDGTKGKLNLIGCFFHWFGVSICNYARLAGFLCGIGRGSFTMEDLADVSKHQAISKSITAYVETVSEIKDVLVWRNKVAAHFAITDPRKADNIATLELTTMFPVTFDLPHYRVGGMTLTRKNSLGTFTGELPNWSLTEVFESLIPRYWPTMRFQWTPGAPKLDLPPELIQIPR